MNWIHEASAEWMMARRNYITATELIGLRSAYKRMTNDEKQGRKIAPAFAALWGAKTMANSVNTLSYGAAARGHYMEPYAVEDYNANKGTNYYHWDDCLIYNGTLCFSPDALDIKQYPGAVEVEASVALATSMLEIKSYEIKHHMQCYVTQKEKIDERYQIAVAMMVCPSIQQGTVLFYNPNAEISMFSFEYSREDLENEIKELSNIYEVWKLTASQIFNSLSPNRMIAKHTEEDIIKETEERMKETWQTAKLFD